MNAFSLFDDEVQQCFAECTAVDTSDSAWQQAQLSLSRGGLGLRRVSYHSPAAYLASAVNSGLSYEVCRYLHHSVDLYNNLVDPPDSLTSDFVDNSCSSTTQKFLSNKIEDCQFRKLFNNSTPIDRARLLSISPPHTSAWLSVTPSPSMGLHLEPSEFQVAIKWSLGIPVAQGQSCTQCTAALDAYGHHALCCKLGGDVVSRHNKLRDIFNDFCHSACLAPQLEMGGWSREHTRPADVLVPNWVLDKSAAFDLSVTSTLNAHVFQEASVTAGSAAMAAQIRKHRVNDGKCSELGWVCIPLVVETYGCWGTEAIQALSRLATRLSTRQGLPKSLVCNELFGRLSLALVRANSRAILSRSL